MVAPERQVLPKNVVPEHYRLFLDPDLANFTYTGKVSIDLRVVEESTAITLNVLDLVTRNVKLNGQAPSGVSTDESAQTIKWTFEEPVPAGNATLEVEFDGSLNDKMCGFYRSVHKDETGNQKVVATTQMEATDCRRAFPCFDEPALKATFDISISSAPHLTVLSNNVVKSVENGVDGNQVTHFATTPKMSTYLVAFVVGELSYVESDLFRVPVRVYATPGLESRCQFSADLAARTLDFFENTFGVAYPLPKCDMIGIHDCGPGAMENWGLVTYRLVEIFYVEGVDSAATKRRVTEFVLHELAHQWFGNLVTMEWWDGLWLNEGFATWMAWHSSNHFFPEWHVWETYLNEAYLGCLSLDGLRSSHPIQVPVKSADEVSQIFDLITYQKGSSVIRMVSKFLGEEVFMQGISHYLKKHAYANTVTSDLWDALSEQSGKDVRKFMDPWILKTGYPIVSVSEPTANGLVTVEQHRYLETGDVKPEEDQVLYPVWLAVSRSDGTVDQNEVLTSRSAEVKVGESADDFFKLNADQTGLYRVKYADSTLAVLIAEGSKGSKSKLSVGDRIGLVSDLQAFAGKELSTTKLLNALTAWKLETEANVVSALLASLESIGRKLTFEDAEFALLFKKFKQQYVKTVAQNLAPKLENIDDMRLLKLKTDIHSIAVASELRPYIDSSLQKFRKVGFEVDADLRASVYIAVAKYGTEDEWRALLKHYTDGTNGVSGNQALSALGETLDLERKREILRLVLNGTVRSQDVIYAVDGVASSGAEGINIAWRWLTANWAQLRILLSASVSLMNYVIETIVPQFTKQEQVEEVEKFFSDKDLKGLNMTLAQAIERVYVTIRSLQRDAGNIEKWLKEHVD